ncbi:MAG: dihydropteroate synthase [Caulobacterales bacterium]|nr:dihydropteroate synthase [Caulobacterales bacterium]
MGVVNVTPDSFSDGGRFLAASRARDHALRLVEDGADILDIGGESTRHGAEPVSGEAELDRVGPVIEAVRAGSDAFLSIDTMKPAVARAAVAAGADVWNDVSALRHEPDSPAVAAAIGAPVVLMHMQGAPRTMQGDPRYGDVVEEVGAFLHARVEAAAAAGLARARILIDPGVGFGKTLAHNLALLRALPALSARCGRPALVGASRKRFIAAIDERARDASDRIGGSLAAALFAARQGARVIRVHDVRETVQALRVQAAMEPAA